jgi:hypothetical protein
MSIDRISGGDIHFVFCCVRIIAVELQLSKKNMSMHEFSMIGNA